MHKEICCECDTENEQFICGAGCLVINIILHVDCVVFQQMRVKTKIVFKLRKKLTINTCHAQNLNYTVRQIYFVYY